MNAVFAPVEVRSPRRGITFSAPILIRIGQNVEPVVITETLLMPSLNHALQPLAMAAFTGGLSVPSARFRLRQYIGELATQAIKVEEFYPSLGCYPPSQTWKRPFWLVGSLSQRLSHVWHGRDADISFLQREFISTFATLEPLTRHPRVFDVDDAVHLFRDGHAARFLGPRMDMILAGNSWLAEAWKQWCPNVHIIPTGVDCTQYPDYPLPEQPVIGWIGTSGNLPYLEKIAPALQEVTRRIQGLKILVCCDKPANLVHLPQEFLPWSPEAESAFFKRISIGVMPLEDNVWVRGKCSFKMLQYLAAGRPCVASPYGMNAEVISQTEGAIGAVNCDDWTDALLRLLQDTAEMIERGHSGKSLVKSRYDVGQLAPQISNLVRSLLH